jgi:hypothetical protein
LDDGAGHIVTTHVSVLQPLADYIRIEDINGDVISNVVLSVGQTITLFAAGYNDTAGYFGNVNVDWSLTLPGVGTFSDGSAARSLERDDRSSDCLGTET